MDVRAPLLLILLASCKREPAPRPSPPPPQRTPAAQVDGSTSPPPAAAFDPPAAPADFRETARFLPQGSPLEGWTQSGAVRVINGQDLFQLIDGAGEKYLAYGFRQLARTDYRKAGTELVITAEIYDMGSPLGAFGQYSMLLSDARDPASLESQATQHGGGGFLGTSQLVFWKGQYLVQINLVDDSGERDENALRSLARETLPAVANRVAAALPGDTAAPQPPQGLPREGLVWGGATYLAQGVFGVERTGPAWVGHYRSADNQRWRVALFNRASADDARTVAGLFRGAHATTIAGVGDEAFSATGPSGEVVVARKGSNVVVIADAGVPGLNAPAREARVERLRAVVAALP